MSPVMDFLKANIIQKNLCKLCLSCFPLSTAENTQTKSELNLFWFIQSCLCLLTLPDHTEKCPLQLDVGFCENLAELLLLLKSCLKELSLKNGKNEFLLQMSSWVMEVRLRMKPVRPLALAFSWGCLSSTPQQSQAPSWQLGGRGTVYFLRESILWQLQNNSEL